MAEKMRPHSFRRPGKIVMGLTGSIAAGKSEAARCLARLGAQAICADSLAAAQLRAGAPGWKAVKKKFGARALSSDGGIDRVFLAEKVFADDGLRKWLENTIHPYVIIEASETIRKTKRTIIVFDAPLLFEAGLGDMFDITVCVHAEEKIRLARAAARGWTKEEFLRRSRAQFAPEEKAARADIVIDNSGPGPRLRGKIETLYKALNSLKFR